MDSSRSRGRTLTLHNQTCHMVVADPCMGDLLAKPASRHGRAATLWIALGRADNTGYVPRPVSGSLTDRSAFEGSRLSLDWRLQLQQA